MKHCFGRAKNWKKEATLKSLIWQNDKGIVDIRMKIYSGTLCNSENESITAICINIDFSSKIVLNTILKMPFKSIQYYFSHTKLFF